MGSNFRFDGITKALAVGLSENIGKGLIHDALDLGVAGLNRSGSFGDELGVVIIPVGVCYVSPIPELQLEGVMVENFLGLKHGCSCRSEP